MRARVGQRRHRIGPARWVAVLLVWSLLSLSLHVAYDTPPAFARADVTDVEGVMNAEQQLDRSLPDDDHGRVHCHSSASCSCCAPIPLPPTFLDFGPDSWPLQRATFLPPLAVHRHFHPPRLPAHV